MTELSLSNSLTDLAARIKIEHEATATALKRSVEHAMAAGALLIEAKAQVPHGQWLPWLRDHCQVSERMAQRYIRLARNRELIEAKFDTVSHLGIKGASDAIVGAPVGNLIPIYSHRVRVGFKANEKILIAPSSQSRGFYYVTHITLPLDKPDDCVTSGCIIPIAADYVGTIVEKYLVPDFDEKQWKWENWQCPDWSYNILLSDREAA